MPPSFEIPRRTGKETLSPLRISGPTYAVALNRYGRDTARMTNLDLTGRLLTALRLSGCLLTGSDFSGADLRGARITNCCLQGANLRVCELTGADLRGSDLSCASWPLSESGFGARLDARQALMLATQFVMAIVEDEEICSAQRVLAPLCMRHLHPEEHRLRACLARRIEELD